jgi:hypothetical protein
MDHAAHQSPLGLKARDRGPEQVQWNQAQNVRPRSRQVLKVGRWFRADAFVLNAVRVMRVVE